jgi:hypothetical protein
MALQAGDLGGFEPALRAMVAESDIAASWKPAYGLALLAAGDRAGAMAILDDFGEPPLDYFWLTTMQTWGELAIGLQRRDVVTHIFEVLRPYGEQLGITGSGTLCLGLVATTLGGLAIAMGEHITAIELLDDAVVRADAMGAPFESVKTRRLLAAALLAAGQRVHDVRPLLETATELAERHGFRGELFAVSELMAADPREA